MHYILAFLFLAQLCHVSLKCFRSLPSFCLLLHDADTASSSQADAYTIHYLCTSYKSPFPLRLSKGLQTKRKLLLIVFLCPLHPCLSYSSQPHPHVPSLFTTTFLLHPIPLHSPHLSQIPSFLLHPKPFLTHPIPFLLTSSSSFSHPIPSSLLIPASSFTHPNTLHSTELPPHSLQSLTIDSSTSSVASCTMSYCNISWSLHPDSSIATF